MPGIGPMGVQWGVGSKGLTRGQHQRETFWGGAPVPQPTIELPCWNILAVRVGSESDWRGTGEGSEEKNTGVSRETRAEFRGYIVG